MYYACGDRENDTLTESTDPTRKLRDSDGDFRCRTCGKEGTWVYDPERFTCPLCDSIDVHFIISREEVPEGDPLLNYPDSPSKKDDKNFSPSNKAEE